MPRDKRLYMTFPNNFWMHAKIRPLSDAAFRTFVELNGYSRMEDVDGRVPIVLAKVMWKKRALDELTANHPERPSLTVDGDDYVIWNYAEHQETKESRAERVATNTANGSKGGRPPKRNPTETDSVSESEPNDKQSQSQSQRSESEIEQTDVTKELGSSHLLREADGDSDQGTDLVMARAKRAGITDLASTRRLLEKATGRPVSMYGAVLLSEAITSKAPRPVQKVDSYVAKACRTTPDEVLEAYDDLDIAGVA